MGGEWGSGCKLTLKAARAFLHGKGAHAARFDFLVDHGNGLCLAGEEMMCRRIVETQLFEQIDVQGWLDAFTH